MQRLNHGNEGLQFIVDFLHGSSPEEAQQTRKVQFDPIAD